MPCVEITLHLLSGVSPEALVRRVRFAGGPGGVEGLSLDPGLWDRSEAIACKADD